MNWWIVISGVLAVVSALLTVRWIKVKHLLKAFALLLTDLSDTLVDDNVTAEELRKILADCDSVVQAAKDLAGR